MTAKEKNLESGITIPVIWTLVFGVLLSLYAYLDSGRFEQLYNAAKFDTTEGLTYVVLAVVSFALSYILSSFFVGAVVSRRTFVVPSVRVTNGLLIAFLLLVSITVAAHLNLLYLARGLFGDIYSSVDAKGELNLQGTSSLIPFVGFTPLVSALAGHLLFATSLSRGMRALCIGLLFLLGACVIVRFLFLERLPLFEFIVPGGWAYVRHLNPRRALGIGLLGFVGVFGLFGFAGYFRGWNQAVNSGIYSNSVPEFLEYTVYEFAGYYITPINHAGAMIQHDKGQATKGYYTLRYVANTAGFGKFFEFAYPKVKEARAAGGQFWLEYLIRENGLSPTYNLFGYYGSLFLDWGWAALAVSALLGVYGGALMALSRNDYTIGALLFPIFVIGLMEAPRYLYWLHERSFYATVVAVMISFLIPRISRNR